MSLPLFSSQSGADFSPCRRYRYRLWRSWGDGARCNFIMLNPSTADETDNDPTVERCERRARSYGFGGLVVTNLFAFRATDPKAMLREAEPIGPGNNDVLIAEAEAAGLVVCAWGALGRHRGRAAEVSVKLRDAGVRLHALRVSPATGQPEHPLYIPYSVKPAPWRTAS